MIYGYEDGLTLLLMIIGVIVVIVAQFKVNGAYKKYKVIKNQKKLTGFEVARKILDNNNLNDIHIVETKGELSDHYDPKRKVLRLSHDVFHGDSIASLAVAAHEVGHALQDKDNYFMLKLRSMLVPVVNITSYLGYFGILVGIVAGITYYFTFAIIILLASLLFQLITLPVEFDASKRAVLELQKGEFLEKNEKDYAKNMLDAAAFTYVAAFLSTLLNLLRLIIMRGRDD